MYGSFPWQRLKTGSKPRQIKYNSQHDARGKGRFDLCAESEGDALVSEALS